MIRTLLLLPALALVAGCGVVYTNPQVTASGGSVNQADLDVRVIPMTFETVAEANLAPFAPARLPAAFTPDPVSATVPGARATRPGALPEPATERPAPRRAAEVSPPPASPPGPYRIGVADVVLLSVDSSSATLSDVPALLVAQGQRQGYTVQDDGAIAVPNVGRIQIGGLTLAEAEDAVFQALVTQGVDPSFSLEIAEFNSQRVSVGGAVNLPKVAPITLKPLMLSEALQLAGGVAPTVDLDDAVVRIFRDGQAYSVPLRTLYADAALNDVLLRDGDTIHLDPGYDRAQARAAFDERLRLREAALTETQLRTAEIQLETSRAQLAGERREDDAAERAAFRARLELGAVSPGTAYLTGEARRTQVYPLPFERVAVLADLLFSDEGLSMVTADYGEIYVIRTAAGPDGFGGVDAWRLDASNAAALANATQFQLRPNDVVFVAQQPVSSWNRVLSQLFPSLIFSAVNTVSGI